MYNVKYATKHFKEMVKTIKMINFNIFIFYILLGFKKPNISMICPFCNKKLCTACMK